MIKSALFSLALVVLFVCLSFGQTSNSNSNANIAVQPVLQNSPPANPNDTILKYEQFLRDETKLHREYTQQYYTNLLILIGAMGTILGGVLAWLNWKSKEAIRNQVEQKFKENAGILLDEKFGQVDTIVIQSREKSAQQFEEINKLLLELSAKSKQISVQSTEPEQLEQAVNLSKLNDKRILWVDDIPNNNTHPRLILEQAGVIFSLAFTTEEAVALLSQQNFDLIISDMGRFNNREAGLDLLKELNMRGMPIPVIIYSASMRAESFAAQTLNAGAFAVSAGVTSLLSSVYEALTKKNSRQE